MAYIGLVMKSLLPVACRMVTAAALAAPLGVAADSGAEAHRAMGLRPGDVLTGTVLNARVLPGRSKQVVCVTTYFTGKRERHDAVNVRLDVFSRQGDDLRSIYTRDFGAEHDGNVGGGELQIVDLDLDGVNDIIVSWDSFEDPLIRQRRGEVIVWDDGDGFRAAWSGLVEYDATRAARSVPPERRDRFRREFDIASTLGTRGITLFVDKTMIAVAGERLREPKVVQETYPLRRP